MKFKMQVFKVEMLIITADIDTEKELINVIENTKYPNWCISPIVKNIKHIEVDWNDDHKLNNSETCDEEYNKLFNIK